MIWVVAVEDPNRQNSTTANYHRVHAYNALDGKLAHDLGFAVRVDQDQPWAEAAETNCCRHCIEIVARSQ